MTSSASALWHQAKRFLSWDKEKAVPEPDRYGLRLVHVGDARFVAIPASKEPRMSSSSPKYLTVLDAGGLARISGSWVTGQLQAFRACDTFQPDFLRGILFTTSTEDAALEPQARAVLRNAGVEWTSVLSKSSHDQSALRPGPYLSSCNFLFELRRIHDDTHECFVTTVIQVPSIQPCFQSLPFGSSDRATAPAAAVPSRLTTSTAATTANLPLAGLRIAVKDNFDLAGITTSLCNAAYASFHPPAAVTAACVQRLVDRGATVLGKTRLSSFAATEEPLECIDWPAPWNPRADGYQSPAGSSSGSGAAVAAYEWLDAAVGSDTSGSGRRPALWNGVVALRPTHGVLPMKGFVPSFERFDVPTVFTRDLRLCKRLVDVWYGDGLPKVEKEELPVKLLLPMEYLTTIRNRDQLRLIEGFVADMERCLGVQAQMVELESRWAESTPAEAGGCGLSEYMEAACRNSFWHDDFHNLDEFRSAYEVRFGKKPYVSPPVRWQWGMASKISRAERDDATDKLEVYRNWFTEKIMRVKESNTIVILPVEEISPRYRDEPPSRKFYPKGVPMLFLSPIIGGPELTIPIGQVPYDSKVTGREEFLPVGVSLMASPGYDLVLIDMMLRSLEHTHRPITVKAGRELFSSP